MFESTIELFDRYYRKMDSENVPGFNKDLGCEVRERLEQLDYLVTAVRDREQRHEAIMKRSGDAFKKHVSYVKEFGLDWEKTLPPVDINPTREEVNESGTAIFEMELFTEGFYYFAGRLRTILRNKAEPLPKLGSFECEGARNVRNKLLEHSEGKDTQVSIRSFGFGAPQGPVLKSIRYQGQENVFPDTGLYRNALEIKENLERLINKALI